MNAKESLPRKRRVRANRDFDAVFAMGSRVHGRFVTVLACTTTVRGAGSGPRPEPAAARLGVSCGKKFSKRAVDRNRFKRIVREAFRRLAKPPAAGFDFVVIPRCKPPDVTFKDIEAELARSTVEAVRRFREKPRQAPIAKAPSPETPRRPS